MTKKMKPSLVLACIFFIGLIIFAYSTLSYSQSWDEEDSERSASREVLSDEQDARNEGYGVVNDPPPSQSWDERDSEMSANREIYSDEQEADREIDTKVYGRVTDIDYDQNTIWLVPTGWGSDSTDAGSDQAYYIEPKANFTGRSSLDGISPSDYITINYYVFHDRNIATDIIFEKMGEKSRNSSDKVEYDVPKALVD